MKPVEELKATKRQAEIREQYWIDHYKAVLNSVNAVADPQYHKQYYELHKEEHNKQMRDYYELHKEEYSKRAKKYRELHKDERNKKQNEKRIAEKECV